MPLINKGGPGESAIAAKAFQKRRSNHLPSQLGMVPAFVLAAELKFEWSLPALSPPWFFE
jgi:hypothetical protein